MIFENMNEAEWQHQFAGRFFDIFVGFELKVFGKRYMFEDRLWEIAYDNAVATFNKLKENDPSVAASKVISQILTDSRI